jgi:hypothetical protein
MPSVNINPVVRALLSDPQKRQEYRRQLIASRPQKDEGRRIELEDATGKVVHLSLKENPELLGGVAVQIGSQRLDASLSAALNHMRRELLASNS